MGIPVARRGLAVFIAPPAAALACLRLRALAAGVTWTTRTSAPWAARDGHTSVIDAAGTIYVIGGYGDNTYFNDVWASTDGGADRTRSEGGRGYWGEYYRGYLGSTARV